MEFLKMDVLDFLDLDILNLKSIYLQDIPSMIALYPKQEPLSKKKI